MTKDRVMLASLDRRAENVCVHPIVVSELEFGDVEREILFADLVECAHHAALNDRPEAFDGVRVDRASNILVSAMVNDAEWVFATKRPIPFAFIGAQETDFVRNHFTHECAERDGINVIDYSRNDIAFALDGSGHGDLAMPASSAEVTATARPPMLVLSLTADPCFVYFDNADQLAELLITQRSSDLMAHEPRGFVGSKAHVAHDLQCADSLLAGQHQVNDAKPLAQRLVGVLEDRPDENREPIALWQTILALPMPRLTKRPNFVMAATRAVHAIGPAIAHQVCAARIFMRKHRLELGDAKLVNPWLLSLDLLHDRSPSVGGSLA